MKDFIIHVHVDVYEPDPSGKPPRRRRDRLVVTVPAESPRDAVLRLQGTLMNLVGTPTRK